MTGPIVFRVRQRPGGWTAEGAVWTSAVMAKDDAMNLALGMAAVIREAGEAARVIIVSADGEEEVAGPP